MDVPVLAFEPKSPYPVSKWDWYVSTRVDDRFEQFHQSWLERKIPRRVLKTLLNKYNCTYYHRNRSEYNRQREQSMGI